MKVGVIIRGKHGRRAVKQISKYFDVKTFELPKNLPELIDKPSDYIQISQLSHIFDVDILISYALHPDINLELVRIAGKKGVKLMIIPGGAKSGSRVQLKKASGGRIKLLLGDICCAMPALKDEEIADFFKYFGPPEFEIDVESGKIKDVRVKRAAICGSSYFVAEKLRNVDVRDAPSRAGYLTQIYPCYASRGINGKIHRSASLHKRAVERALKLKEVNK
jgi:hypothetical protein